MKKIVVLCLLNVILFAQSMYVVSDDLDVRLSASSYGYKTSELLKAQKVDVYEVQNGWARISEYYDGLSEGSYKRVARWVKYDKLSHNKPIKEITNFKSPVANAIKESDDFEKYEKSFIEISEILIQKGICTIKDFNNEGGWTRSAVKGKGVYFLYCGGYTLKNKVYFNAITGKSY
jgi:predicted ribonuclease YlaK